MASYFLINKKATLLCVRNQCVTASTKKLKVLLSLYFLYDIFKIPSHKCVLQCIFIWRTVL